MVTSYDAYVPQEGILLLIAELPPLFFLVLFFIYIGKRGGDCIIC